MSGSSDNPDPMARLGDLERTVRALDEREAALLRVLDAVPGGVVEVLPGGQVYRANGAAQRFLGLNYDELTSRYISEFRGRTWWEDGTPCPVEAYPVSRCLATGEPQGPSTIGVEQPSGAIRWAVFTAIPVPHGDRWGAIVTFLDLTERKADEEDRKRIEAQLQLADRLASLGTLAAGVAHEINNPLTYVIGNLHKAVARIGDPDALRAVRHALDGAERVRDIVKNLNRFTRWDAGARTPFDVHRALETAIEMTRVEWRHRAALVRVWGDVPAIGGNEGAAVQVFVNVLVNAAQALPHGAADAHTITITTEAQAPWVVVTVRDDGAGMDADTLAHALDAFFTTKPAGEGTGLGLTVSHGLVTSMGGRLGIESVAGGGTTVRIHLLASDGPADVPLGPMPEARAARPGARILVVDDEADVRDVLAWFLEHHVIDHAADGREALERLRTHPYDVVMCDLMMPEVTGMDVYRDLQRERPGMESRIVFMTGGAYTEAARAFLDAIRNPVLIKPFDRTTVLRMVDAVLGAAG